VCAWAPQGNAQFPQCGFSNTVVQVLNHHGVPFKAVNVLDDAQLKESLKTFSQWPTIPQLYLNGLSSSRRRAHHSSARALIWLSPSIRGVTAHAGEFYGGCDIVLEGFEDGTLEEELEIALTS
jgi:monothiol glutaredoxin